jgi:hypothetical protein
MRQVLAVALAVISVSVALNAADNPLIGTWKINLDKSTFSPGPRPMGSIVTFEEKGNQIVQSVNNVGAEGNKIVYSVTYAFDGKDYPVKGDPARDSVAWKRIDPHTLEATNKKDGKITTHQKRSISTDGKSFTLTTTGVSPQGQSIKNVEFYEKQ